MLSFLFVVFAVGICIFHPFTVMGTNDFIFKTNPDTPRAALWTPSVKEVASSIESKFTICLWTYIEACGYKGDVSLVSYFSDDSDEDNELLLEVHCKDYNYTALTIHGVAAVLPEAPPLRQWTHICVFHNSDYGMAAFYFDGQLVGGRIKGTLEKLRQNGFFLLGQDQDYKKDGGFDVNSGLNGRMTKVNVWNATLTPAEVRLNYKCQYSGNVVNWENSVWTLKHNMMVQPTTMTNCPSESCDTKSQTCQKPTHTSSYDITTPISATADNNNVRSILKTPTFNSALTEFTICFHLYFNEPMTHNIYPISYLKGDSKEILFGFSNQKLSYIIGKQEVTIAHYIPRGKWFHICLTWSGSNNGKVAIYINGFEGHVYDSVNPNYVIPEKGDLFLTQDQVAPSDPDNSTNGFNMKVTDFNMWSRVLTKTEVEEVFVCSNAAPADQIISSADAVYELAP